MSKGEVVKAGYLTKSPPEGRLAIAQWQRRWFVFADSHRAYPLADRYIRMEYYQSEEDAEKCKDPKGIVDLKNCSKVTNRENMRGFKHVFDVVTQERKYHLVADNELEKRSWIDILNTTLFTHSQTHTSSQDTKQQQRQVPRPSALQPTARNFLQSTNSSQAKMARPVSFTGDTSASKQNSRPLPPVPSSTTAINRPLPPTPPDHASTPTRYKRLLESQSSLVPFSSSQREHKLIRQTKSSSAVQEGPEHYQLSSTAAPDYENLQTEDNMQDYANVDQDYDDTITSTELDVYERFTPQPVGTTAAPVTSTHQVPISRSVGYVNVENSNIIPDVYSLVEAGPLPPSNTHDYSLLEASPLQSTLSDENYSVLEVVHSQPTHRDGNYSRLDLTGHLDLSPPKKPPPYNPRRKATDVDYENLSHVAHPDAGDYSNLQH